MGRRAASMAALAAPQDSRTRLYSCRIDQSLAIAMFPPEIKTTERPLERAGLLMSTTLTGLVLLAENDQAGV